MLRRSNATRHQSFLRNVSVVGTTSSGNVVSIPAGAAGSVVDFDLGASAIASEGGNDIGGEGDSSVSITAGDVFTTLVGYKEDDELTNGEYYIDHLTGAGRGKKASTNTTMTFSYRILTLQTSQASLGLATPSVDSYDSVVVSLSAGADQQLVAAPGANKQIWVYGYQLTVNAAGSISFQDEDDTVLSGVMPLDKGIAVPPSGDLRMPLFKVATNKALELDVVTSEVDGTLQYAVVSV